MEAAPQDAVEGLQVTDGLSPRQERAQRLSDRLRAGQNVDAWEVAAMITELAEDSRLVRTLLAIRMLAKANAPHSEIVEMVNEVLS